MMEGIKSAELTDEEKTKVTQFEAELGDLIKKYFKLDVDRGLVLAAMGAVMGAAYVSDRTPRDIALTCAIHNVSYGYDTALQIFLLGGRIGDETIN